MKLCLAFLAPFVVAACATCTPSPGPNSFGDAGPPPPDGQGPPARRSDSGIVTVYDGACYQLHTLGCTDGDAPNCAAVMEHVVADHLRPMDPLCILKATDKATARGCGASCPE